MSLLFVPLTPARLTSWAQGGMLAGTVDCHAVTPALRSAFDAADDEEAEHLALLVASIASLARSGQRLVAVAEGTPRPAAGGDADFGDVVASDLRWGAVQSIFADEPGTPEVAAAAVAASGLPVARAWNEPAVITLLEDADLLWHGAGEWEQLGNG